MVSFLMDIIDYWIIEFDLQGIRDILLEFLAVIAFIFLLVVIIIAMIRAPMLIGHGSIEMGIFVIFGLIHSVMNMFDEFIRFTSEFYTIWKLMKDLFLLIGVIILIVGFFRFFRFSARLFGTDTDEENEKAKLNVEIDYVDAKTDEVPFLTEPVKTTEADRIPETPNEDITEEIAEEATEEEPEVEAVEDTTEIEDFTEDDVIEETIDDTVEENIQVTEEKFEEVEESIDEEIEEEKSVVDTEFS